MSDLRISTKTQVKTKKEKEKWERLYIDIQRKYKTKAQTGTKIVKKIQYIIFSFFLKKWFFSRKTLLGWEKNPELQINTSQQVSRTRKPKKTLAKYIWRKMFKLNDLKKIILAARKISNQKPMIKL